MMRYISMQYGISLEKVYGWSLGIPYCFDFAKLQNFLSDFYV